MVMPTMCANHLGRGVVLVYFSAFVCETKRPLVGALVRRISGEQSFKCVASAIGEPAYDASFVLNLQEASGARGIRRVQHHYLSHEHVS